METHTRPSLHPDPITDEPGSHPVGTGVGAAALGAAGAALGTVGGPLGVVLGATLGAVAGGLTGKAIAEGIDPTAEDAYWRTNYRREPYVDRDLDYDDYAPAFRLGYDGYVQRGGSFSFNEDRLEDDWERLKGKSRLSWDRAKHAVRAGWERAQRTLSGAVPVGHTD